MVFLFCFNHFSYNANLKPSKRLLPFSLTTGNFYILCLFVGFLCKYEFGKVANLKTPLWKTHFISLEAAVQHFQDHSAFCLCSFGVSYLFCLFSV